MQVRHVTFLSPGSFVSEQTTRPIDDWDPTAAVAASEQIVERYGAKPYAFFFTTSITAPDVSDGMGGTLKVESREIERSGLHFLGGEILSVEDAERRAGESPGPDNQILVSNMRCNWPLVCEARNGYRHCAPFGKRDVIVDAAGTIVERGDTPERIAYRARFA